MAPMAMFNDQTMNQDKTPRCMDWHARMMERPAVKETFAMAKHPMPYMEKTA